MYMSITKALLIPIWWGGVNGCLITPSGYIKRNAHVTDCLMSYICACCKVRSPFIKHINKSKLNQLWMKCLNVYFTTSTCVDALFPFSKGAVCVVKMRQVLLLPICWTLIKEALIKKTDLYLKLLFIQTFLCTRRHKTICGHNFTQKYFKINRRRCQIFSVISVPAISISNSLIHFRLKIKKRERERIKVKIVTRLSRAGLLWLHPGKHDPWVTDGETATPAFGVQLALGLALNHGPQWALRNVPWVQPGAERNSRGHVLLLCIWASSSSSSSSFKASHAQVWHLSRVHCRTVATQLQREGSTPLGVHGPSSSNCLK